MIPIRRQSYTVQAYFPRKSPFYPYYHVVARENHNYTSSKSASAKLFADAANEDQGTLSSKSTQISILEQQNENWTGEENVKDAVLRMLVDKYKPYRTGTIQTAEEKLRRNPPKLASARHPVDGVLSFSPVSLYPPSGSWASEPLLASTEGHQPWHTQFKLPSHALSSIKFANIPPSTSSKSSSGTLPLDDRARRLEKEKRKKVQQAGRLTQARESTLDYRMGIKSPRGIHGRPNPHSLKGWTSLIEDKIEKARQAGLFDSVKGRGLPIACSTDEHNPFIAREEFIMNRIVQRNGAAPPWVEVQGELETAVNTFREILRQSWIRRVTRMLASEHPAELFSRLTLEDIKRHRDPDWVAKESGYHGKAIAELNTLVRKYNGLAPYAVRRSYYLLEAEIERLYDDSAPDILRTIAERVGETKISNGDVSKASVGRPGDSQHKGRLIFSTFSFLQWLRAVIRRCFGYGA